MGIFSFLGKSNTLYFPGCTTYFKFKEHYELYQKIFSKLRIDFNVLQTGRCSGLEPWEAGYEKMTRKIARENFEIFNKENIKSIITNSPGAYKILLQNYPEYLFDWNIEVKNLWKIILDRLNSVKIVERVERGIITYNDNCYLGRYCKVYDEPRKILELIGYKIKEMDNSRENSYCSGSCGGLPRIHSVLADKIAKEKLLQAKRIGVNKMIVIGFEDYDLLKKNSIDMGIQVLEISEVLANALGIRKIDGEIEEETSGKSILLETKANIILQEELIEENYYDDIK